MESIKPNCSKSFLIISHIIKNYLIMLLNYFTKTLKNMYDILWDFLGGPMVQNTPNNAGETGLIPGLGRSHMLQRN